MRRSDPALGDARALADPALVGRAPALLDAHPSGDVHATSADSMLPADGSRRWTLVSAIAGSIALFVAGVAVALVVSKNGSGPVETVQLASDAPAGHASGDPSAAAGGRADEGGKAHPASGARGEHGTAAHGGAREGAKHDGREGAGGAPGAAQGHGDEGGASGADTNGAGSGRASGAGSGGASGAGTSGAGTNGAGAGEDLTPPIPSGGTSGGTSDAPDASVTPEAAPDAGPTPATSPEKVSPGTVPSPDAKTGLGRLEPARKLGDKLGAGGKLTLPLRPGHAADAGTTSTPAPTEPARTAPTTEGDGSAKTAPAAAEGTSSDPAKTDPARATAQPKVDPAKAAGLLEKVLGDKAPAGPKKLGANFQLEATMTDLQVAGGLSVNRSSAALERYVADAKVCLRKELARLGVESKGAFEVTARIDQYGALREVRAKGPLPAAEACVAAAFASARLPKPDTGDASLRFTLRYSAAP